MSYSVFIQLCLHLRSPSPSPHWRHNYCKKKVWKVFHAVWQLKLSERSASQIASQWQVATVSNSQKRRTKEMMFSFVSFSSIVKKKNAQVNYSITIYFTPHSTLHTTLLETSLLILVWLLYYWSPVRAHIKIKERYRVSFQIPTFDTLLVSTNCIFINPSLKFNDYIQP